MHHNENSQTEYTVIFRLNTQIKKNSFAQTEAFLMLSSSFYSPKVITILISNKTDLSFLALWIYNFHFCQKFLHHYLFKYCFCLSFFPSSMTPVYTHFRPFYCVLYISSFFISVSFISSVDLSSSSLILSSALSNQILNQSINSSL